MKSASIAALAFSSLALTVQAQQPPFHQDPQPTHEKIAEHQRINTQLFAEYNALRAQSPAKGFEYIGKALGTLPKATRRFGGEMILGSSADRWVYGVCSLAAITLGKAERKEIEPTVIAANAEVLSEIAATTEEKCGFRKGEMPRFSRTGGMHNPFNPKAT